MDPLDFRGEVPRLSALERLARDAERVDVDERRREAAKREADREHFETGQAMAQACARAEIALWGHTTLELRRAEAERQARHNEALAEAWKTVERYDPRAAKAKQAELDRASEQTQTSAALARAAAVRSDSFMARQREQYHLREIARKSGRHAAREIVR